MKNFYFSQDWWQFLLMAIVCYFIGCFNFARVIARKRNKDITKIGSGNPGTMNMSREFGLKIGLLTFVCDALKGGVPALVSYFIYRKYQFAGTEFVVSDLTRYYCGLFVVIGHIFPVTTHFKGGKGIASTLGLFWFALSCENAWWILLGFGIAVILVGFIYFTEWGSLGSLLGVTGVSIIQMVIFLSEYGKLPFNAYMACAYMVLFAINVLTWFAHRGNIMRLFAGEEHHTSFKKSSKKK
jgi:glycerol-3-phosphate acyltransferase PlsY